jgi:hypothetical protein
MNELSLLIMAAKIGKNVKFRPDQIQALADMVEAEKTVNPDIDFSKLVRRGVDKLLSEQKVQESAPKYKAKKKSSKCSPKSTSAFLVTCFSLWPCWHLLSLHSS